MASRVLCTNNFKGKIFFFFFSPFLLSVPGTVAKTETSVKMDELFPEALNGFMLVLSNDGNMVYLSENVSEYLGVSQVDAYVFICSTYILHL